MTPTAPAVESLPDVGAGSVVTRFSTGARFALGSIRYTLSHPSLLRAALVPMAVQLVLLTGLSVTSVKLLQRLTLRFIASPEALPLVGRIGLWIGVGVVAVAAAAILTFFLGSIVCDPFYDRISERTEALVTGHQVAGSRGAGAILSGVARELWSTTVRLLVWLIGLGVLFVVSLVPGVAVLGGPLSMAWTWLFVAVEVFARPQARGTAVGRARLVVVRQHLALSLGFGAGGWLITFLPFTTPMLVVGGTRLYLALAAHGRLDPASTATTPSSG